MGHGACFTCLPACLPAALPTCPLFLALCLFCLPRPLPTALPAGDRDRPLLIKYRPAKKAAIHLRALGLVDEDGVPTEDRWAAWWLPAD